MNLADFFLIEYIGWVHSDNGAKEPANHYDELYIVKNFHLPTQRVIKRDSIFVT